MTHLLIATLLLLPIGTASPDDRKQALEAKRAAEGMHMIAYGGMGVTRRIVNKPFEAEAIVETTRTLSDGTRIVRHNTTRYFRDREGRIRREQTIRSIGSYTAVAPFQLIVISDPVAQRDYIIDPAAKTVRRFGNFELDGGPNTAPPQSNDLGKRTIEGLECIGTSRTVTIRGITATTETWFAPAIEALIFSKVSDPRFGETIYTMRKVSLTDQPISLFEPPPGYRLEFDGKPGVMKKRTTTIP